ncbi:hypothetical protein Poli38472_012744 [Pythium oligandrum]|uniref:Uncharacterized protein n=1 Tax=Pythium oligandrum TaxID=41045 RepID=A0A8K1CFE6_PYTOL|nr:hypothetical protein Poli38472_012744 [Pythium oligandrum]|eukprot:TMW61553.1 hypothetical protein Poli38472_012744 [Pythium oligandrum]
MTTRVLLTTIAVGGPLVWMLASYVKCRAAEEDAEREEEALHAAALNALVAERLAYESTAAAATQQANELEARTNAKAAELELLRARMLVAAMTTALNQTFVMSALKQIH